MHFASWQRVLEPGGVILLHCKSGKDEALKCLSCRDDRHGVAFVNIRGNDLFPTYNRYVADEFFRRVQADALLPSWQYGFG